MALVGFCILIDVCRVHCQRLSRLQLSIHAEPCRSPACFGLIDPERRTVALRALHDTRSRFREVQDLRTTYNGCPGTSPIADVRENYHGIDRSWISGVVPESRTVE